MTAKTAVAASPRARGRGGLASALLIGNARKTSQITLIIQPNRSHGSLGAPASVRLSMSGAPHVSSWGSGSSSPASASAARCCWARRCCSLAVSSSIIMRIVLLPGPASPDQQERRECEDNRPDHEVEDRDPQRFRTDRGSFGGYEI